MRGSWIACALLAACTSGIDAGDDGPGQGTPQDAARDATGPIWIDAPMTDGGVVDCKPPVSTVGDGHHNPGRDCQQSCHNHGFTLSGTVFASATASTAYPGATVTLTDRNNQTIELVTQRNGNFYTKQPIAFPVRVRISACPNAAAMQATVSTAGCNASGCHAQGGGLQIHLP